MFPGKTIPVPSPSYRNRNNHGGAARIHPRFKKVFLPGFPGAFGDCKKHTLFYKSDGNQLDEWHPSRAFLGGPPQRPCKGFKGGKHDFPLCALFASFLWRQRKDVPPRHERWIREKAIIKMTSLTRIQPVRKCHFKKNIIYFSGIIKGKKPPHYLKIPKTGGEKWEGIPYRYRIKVYLP